MDLSYSHATIGFQELNILGDLEPFMHLFIFYTIDVGICGFIGDMQFLQDCFVFLSINIRELARSVLVCMIFFALLNE